MTRVVLGPGGDVGQQRGKVSSGSSQVVPLITPEGDTKWAGWRAWSDLYLADDHRDMKWTLARTHDNMVTLKQIDHNFSLSIALPT